MNNKLKKNWDNLKKGNCIFCGNELKFRVSNRNTKIRARGYKNNLSEDMYFCFRDNFQISREKLLKMVDINNKL